VQRDSGSPPERRDDVFAKEFHNGVFAEEFRNGVIAEGLCGSVLQRGSVTLYWQSCRGLSSFANKGKYRANLFLGRLRTIVL
jgi:hypothetical protein